MVVDCFHSGGGVCSFIAHVRNICKKNHKKPNIMLGAYVTAYNNPIVAKFFREKQQLEHGQIKSGDELMVHVDGAAKDSKWKECLALYDYDGKKIPVKFSIPMISYNLRNDVWSLAAPDGWDTPPMSIFTPCHGFVASMWDKKDSEVRKNVKRSYAKAFGLSSVADAMEEYIK